MEYISFRTRLLRCDQFQWRCLGLEDSFNPADHSTIATLEVIAAMGVKCRSAVFTVPGTSLEVIALAWKCLDVRASSSTAESAHFRNLIEISESCIVVLESELRNCRTDFNELTSANSTFYDRIVAVETRLNDFNDVGTVHGPLEVPSRPNRRRFDANAPIKWHHLHVLVLRLRNCRFPWTTFRNPGVPKWMRRLGI